MNKVFKFCNQIAQDPYFSAVAVFSITFLIAGVFLEMSSVGDNGEECNTKPVKQKNLCTKLNIILLVLAPTVPILAGLTTFCVVRKKMEVSA